MSDYTRIYTDITDDLEARVFEALIENAGERVSRETLIFRICGVRVTRDKLNNSKDDRRIRAAIASLQDRGFPIVASPRASGYLLTTSEDEINAALADLSSRRKHLDAKIAGLRRALQKLPAIQAAKTERAEQLNLFGGGVI